MIKRDTSPLGLMMLNAHRPQKETLLACLLLLLLERGWIIIIIFPLARMGSIGIT
jgi:hypothetical protein